MDYHFSMFSFRLCVYLWGVISIELCGHVFHPSPQADTCSLIPSAPSSVSHIAHLGDLLCLFHFVTNLPVHGSFLKGPFSFVFSTHSLPFNSPFFTQGERRENVVRFSRGIWGLRGEGMMDSQTKRLAKLSNRLVIFALWALSWEWKTSRALLRISVPNESHFLGVDCELVF